MVTVQDIYRLLDQKAPFYSQMGFDNSGHLVGEATQEVKRVLVSLDITEEVAQEAIALGCELIVAHHPVIFGGVKSVTTGSATGRILLALIRANISAICAHTNLDMAEGGVNDCLAEAVGLTEIALLAPEGKYNDGAVYGLGRVGLVEQPMALRDFLAVVQEGLKPNALRYVDAGRTVHRVAVGGGACGEYMDAAIAKGCDTFLTSDLKYHGFLEGKEKGINLIDAGHFPTENVVCPRLVEWLEEAFPTLEILLSKTHCEQIAGYTAEQNL